MASFGHGFASHPSHMPQSGPFLERVTTLAVTVPPWKTWQSLLVGVAFKFQLVIRCVLVLGAT